MQRVICKVVYDTDTATVIEKHTNGAFGDPAGYEETLYQTPEGKFFLYQFGGAESPFAEASIKRISADKAEAWKTSK